MQPMNPENDYSPTLSFPTLDEWEFMLKLGQGLVSTGFMPKGVDTPAKAAAIMLKGRELGIPPMEAIANIAIINGKPSIQAKLMMALVKRAYGRDAIWVEETTDTFAKVGYRRGNKNVFYTFTIDMADKAGLLKPDKWGNESMYIKYPGPMLRARCISAVCIMEFPEVTGGLYVPGELGDDVTVDSTGEVITVEVNSPTRAPQPQERQAAPRPAQPAQPAQIDAGNVDLTTGEILEGRQADPVPARGKQQAPTPQPKAQANAAPRKAPEDPRKVDLKKSMGRLAQERGIGDRLPELLKSKYGKEASDLTFNELQKAFTWLGNAEGPELAPPAKDPEPNQSK